MYNNNNNVTHHCNFTDLNYICVHGFMYVFFLGLNLYLFTFIGPKLCVLLRFNLNNLFNII